MTMPINKKFKVITEYHNEEPSETICETFEELTGIDRDALLGAWRTSTRRARSAGIRRSRPPRR